ncbi:hypothetical protein AVEN_135389-1 [Araneus ventricosus]|uniref:Uncharacterized protein n=1 Tax=Araneus ventricosus TaxID=182803 RepID=A0A4Y2WNW7_ARAVE|nr:hypothetical protein AVEN_135389-1 [Araneus ventricosus]
MFNRPTYTANFWWNWASNLEPSGSEAEIIPLGYRGLYAVLLKLLRLQICLQDPIWINMIPDVPLFMEVQICLQDPIWINMISDVPLFMEVQICLQDPI